MGKILDLSMFLEETLDIKMLDGRVLHIRKPPQRTIIEMMKFREIDENTDPDAVMAALDRMTGLILNNNEDGLRFNADAIAGLSTDMKNAILTEYAKFAARLQQNPTCVRPPCRERKRTAMRNLLRVFGR